MGGDFQVIYIKLCKNYMMVNGDDADMIEILVDYLEEIVDQAQENRDMIVNTYSLH